MKIISVCNHKGGSGKTTCSIHLAASLSLAGHKTLAIDLDPQGFMSRMVGISEPNEKQSALTLFGHQADWQTQYVAHLTEFDFIPSTTALTTALKKLTKPTDVLWLKEILSVNTDYEYIVLDTSSSVTVYTLNALVASHHVVIPVIPEYLPVIGAEQTYQTCTLVKSKLNPELANPYFLLTQVDGRKNIHERYKQYLRSTYQNQVLNGFIRTNAALSEETLQGKTLFSAEPNSKGAIDFANVTDELLGRMNSTESPAPVIEQTLDGTWKRLVEL
ncbi:MAG: ParA family protein [Bacteroidetes Order II. Incertae sedis bacterium]|nr:ParA family protein [Bacteroidetes Order II. bacterium]